MASNKKAWRRKINMSYIHVRVQKVAYGSKTAKYFRATSLEEDPFSTCTEKSFSSCPRKFVWNNDIEPNDKSNKSCKVKAIKKERKKWY